MSHPSFDSKETFEFDVRIDSDGHPRNYVKMTPYGAYEYDKKMFDQGLVKRPIDLPGGRKGFTWERIREQTPEQRAEADRGCATPAPKKPTEMPPPDKRAKPIAAGLDDRHGWANTNTVLEQMGRLPMSGKNPPPEPAEVPVRTDPVHRAPAVQVAADDSPPPLPPELLAAQERDADAVAPRPRGSRPQPRRSEQAQKPPAGEQTWPWRDTDLYSSPELPPRLEDALGEDFEF